MWIFPNIWNRISGKRGLVPYSHYGIPYLFLIYLFSSELFVPQFYNNFNKFQQAKNRCANKTKEWDPIFFFGQRKKTHFLWGVPSIIGKNLSKVASQPLPNVLVFSALFPLQVLYVPPVRGECTEILEIWYAKIISHKNASVEISTFSPSNEWSYPRNVWVQGGPCNLSSKSQMSPMFWLLLIFYKRVLSALNPSQQPTVLFSIYQNNAWTIRRLVDETIDPVTYRIILKIVGFMVTIH